MANSVIKDVTQMIQKLKDGVLDKFLFNCTSIDIEEKRNYNDSWRENLLNNLNTLMNTKVPETILNDFGVFGVVTRFNAISMIVPAEVNQSEFIRDVMDDYDCYVFAKPVCKFPKGINTDKLKSINTDFGGYGYMGLKFAPKEILFFDDCEPTPKMISDLILLGAVNKNTKLFTLFS